MSAPPLNVQRPSEETLSFEAMGTGGRTSSHPGMGMAVRIDTATPCVIRQRARGSGWAEGRMSPHRVLEHTRQTVVRMSSEKYLGILVYQTGQQEEEIGKDIYSSSGKGCCASGNQS